MRNLPRNKVGKPEDLKRKVKAVNQKLLEERSNRIRPGLDDKQLTSWNALMLKGYADAYRFFGEKDYLKAAVKNADFILKTQRKMDGGLWHNHKDGRSTINGFLGRLFFHYRSVDIALPSNF